MKQYPVDKIRNICLASGGGAGKTTLAEACLYLAGASDRFGKIADGNTVSDFDPEEIKRKISISTSIVPCEWEGCKINFIDTPGYLDFVGEMREGIRAADAVVIPVSGKSGVSVGTENAWKFAQEQGIPVVFFINKVDDEKSDYKKVIQQLNDVFGKTVIPFIVPAMTSEGKMQGFIDVMRLKGKQTKGKEVVDWDMPDPDDPKLSKYRDMINDAIAETDDELMEKYFAGEEFTQDEIKKAVKAGIRSGSISPILCGSAQTGEGIALLLEVIERYMPNPEGEYPAINEAGEDTTVKCDENEPLSVFVFKTIADPYVGKMSYFKVMSGTLKADSQVYNSTKEANEKVGRLYTVCGKKQTETDCVKAGDIGAVAKLAITKTGDTLCAPSNKVKFAPVEFPPAVLSLAVSPKNKGDDEKIASGLTKLMEEDPTLSMTNNRETHQLILSGIGEQHLDIVVSKLKSKFGVDVILSEPVTAYRETLRRKVKVEGKHKKQSGGHGQYGHVWIEFEPGEEEELIFTESVVGGAVPKNYFPAVEKGLRDCMKSGILAGYPVVNLKANLMDGSYHPVDSSEMAFKVAASLAFKKGMEEGGTVLLEPVGLLKVNVPDSYTGDIIGDVNKRRGRMLGMNPGSIEAEVPMAEMHKYATDLRSMTQGRGSFTFEFVRYEEAPSNVAQKVIEEAAKRAQE